MPISGNFTAELEVIIKVRKTVEIDVSNLDLPDSPTEDDVPSAIGELSAEEINDVMDNTGCNIDGLDNTAGEHGWETDSIESEVVDFNADDVEGLDDE